MDLYISDLDGTLLNSKREISSYSKEIINDLIAKNIKFSIATARTPGTVIDILEGLKIKEAISLMNGVFLYDLENKKYLKVRAIKKERVKEILDILSLVKKDAFVYGIKNDHLYVYHKKLKQDFDITYYDERKNSIYKTFKEVNDLHLTLSELTVVNFMILDTKENINNIYKKISNISDVNSGVYIDVYDENCGFIEIHSIKASKEQSVKDLKHLYNADRVICFGDNLNDVPMFKVADEKYAMDNGVDSLKKYATKIIDTNDNDGVAKFLDDRFNQN
ncbi:MAG: HAD family hydrolase [Sarcina sp.]